MKKMNKKLLGSLILGLMLSVPVSQVNAIQLNGGGICGTGDKYGDYRELSEDGKTLTYDFGGGSTLTVDGSSDSNGVINRLDSGALEMVIKDQLDIKVENIGKVATLNGITISNGFVNPAEGQVISRSAGGSITVVSTKAEPFYDYPDDLPLEYAPAAALYGASISGGNKNKIDLGDSAITVTAEDANMKVVLQGLYIADNTGLGCTENQIIMGNGEINIIGNVIGNVTPVRPNTMQGIGMMVAGEKNTIETKNVSITVDMTGNENTEKISNSGIEAYSGGAVNTGNGDITINGQGGAEVYSYGISAARGQVIQEGQVIQGSQGTVTKTGGHINVVAEGEGTVMAYGVRALGGIVNIAGSTDVTAKTIGGSTNTQSIGLVGMDDGEINYAGGTITASADNEQADVAAIQVRDSSAIKVNENSQNKVVINGDVKNSGTGAIYLNLNTADSVLNGAVSDENGTFNLENGAQWNVLGASTVNVFHMKDGIINMATDDNVNIASYSGNGTISFLAEDQAADGVANFENVGDVRLENAKAGSFVTLGIANNKIDTLDLEKTEENLSALAKKISYTGDEGTLIGKAVIREGLITPEASGDLLFASDNQGYVGNIFGGNSTTKTMYAMKNLAATAIVAWRQEDSTFSQRLGELRESTGGQGIWARMSRGEFEYDGEYKNQYNFFQLGYDWASDNWHYGVAVSHNDGETAYTYGSGENRSTSLSLYGTWLGDAGHYADIVLK